jgi:phage tail sheath gpL-like
LATPAVIAERNARDPSWLDVLWARYLISGLRIVALLNQFHLLSVNANLPVFDSLAA